MKLNYVVLLLCLGTLAASEVITPTSLSLPGGDNGIGFDDMGFAPALHRVLVPAGRTGKLDLIDPETRQIEEIAGFSASESYGGGHGEGITSADSGRCLIFITDRTARRLNVVDPSAKKIIATASLGSVPDYVRYVAATNEVWVTEPRAERVEVFSLSRSGAPRPAESGLIDVSGGPESLVIDSERDRAYTHLWTDTTLAIDLKTRKVAARWPNGCTDSRGIAIDEKRSFLFAGCNEGKVTVLDLNTGRVLGSAASGSGVDIIAYSPRLGHIYLPGAGSGTMAIVGISDAGDAKVLGTVKTTKGAHCAAADDHDNAYVCDPNAGRLLIVKDSFPSSRK